MSKATYSINEVAQLLGIGKSAAYRAAQAGDLPVPSIKIGGRYVVPKKPLDDILGITDEEPAA